MMLRRATQTDVEAIRSLAQAAYAPWVPVMGREPMPMRFDYAKAVATSIIDLHHDEGMLVAMAQMREASDHLMLINIAVAPSHQGRGLGCALMAHAETTAATRGLAQIRLFTNKLMESNQRFYQRLGYTIDREEPFAGGAVVHMSKRLAGVASATSTP